MADGQVANGQECNCNRNIEDCGRAVEKEKKRGFNRKDRKDRKEEEDSRMKGRDRKKCGRGEDF
jgi:hypothetical protein